MVLGGWALDAGGQHSRLLAPVLGTALAAVRTGKVDFVPGGRPVGVLRTVRMLSVASSAVVTMASCVVITHAGPLVVEVLTVLTRPVRLVARFAAIGVGVFPAV